jgi:hypothetical protein
MARTLTPKDAYALMNALVAQATGQTTLAVTNTSDFVSAGETVLATGIENTLNALATVIGRTFVAVRPYGAKLGILNTISTDGYTNRMRKISFYSKYAEPSGDWNTDLFTNLADGYDNGTNGGASTGSMWVQNQPMPLEMNFGGQSVWEESLTLYENQYKNALRSESEFLELAAGIMTQKTNDIEMTKESFNRMCLLNKIAAVLDTTTYNNGAAIDLIAGFNASVGQTYTRDVVLESHLQEFLQYFTATFKTVSDMMTHNTIKYHWDVPKTVGGDTYNILRHTPKRDQRAILYNPFFTRAKATVFSEIFNPQYLEDGAQYETVDFWQGFDAGPAINVTPAITDMNTSNATYGTQIAGSTVAEDYILGVLYDRDALMIDYQFESANTTPLEARKRYRNMFWHFSKNAINDPTENFVVFFLGAGGP